MSRWRFFFYILGLAILFGFCLKPIGYANPASSEHVTVELISETTSIQPGTTLWLAIRIAMKEGWHTYWHNPGDAGLPTKINWRLPAGFRAGAIEWPFPIRFKTPPLESFGYKDEVFLLTEVNVPNDIQSGVSLDLVAEVDWLECKEICIPGKAELRLSLPVQSNIPVVEEKWVEAFANARARLPIKISDWRVRSTQKEKEILLWFDPPSWVKESLSGASFFPWDPDVIEHAAAQGFSKTASGYALKLKESYLREEPAKVLKGVLVSPDGWRGKNSERALWVEIPIEPAGTTVGNPPLNLATALFFAFLGGLLLNLMPCVFPVLSVKVLGFMKQAGEETRKAQIHGFVFSLGVLTSFWILAFLLIVFRQAGAQIGWGFQLQSPVFVVLLTSLFFMFGLNLFGIFDLGTSLAGIGSQVAGSGSWLGTFLSGTLATVVATPCTAPFMGAALGFGIAQPAWVALLIFTFLGLGMAAPYAILSSSPALLKLLPKPGPWMMRLKQFMGILMMMTVAWLVWVLSIQRGSAAVKALLTSFIPLSAAAWILGRWASPTKNASTRIKAKAFAALFMIAALGWSLYHIGQLRETRETYVKQRETVGIPAPEERVTRGIPWEIFSPERVEEVRRSGKPVFIDFTAAWCLSCQVNDRIVFQSEEVEAKFKELGIVAFKADWTKRDEVVTRALAQYGRSSVPLYILYRSGSDSEPNILPEVLTPRILLDALAQINRDAD